MTGDSNIKHADIVILGGGVAGLSCAYRLSLAGKKVVVLEKENVVGGLARTVEFQGFQFDFCAHRFHSPDPKLMEEVKQLMAENFESHKQKSRILMFGKYVKYPYELQNLLRAMPLWQTALCGVNFCWAVARKPLWTRTPKNYRDWFVRLFGYQLYRVMCEQYTRKIWGRDPALISADWADQRFAGPNLSKLIKKTLRKLMRMDFSSYALEDMELAPDSGTFYYPKIGGIQAMPKRFAQVATQNGATVITGARVASIDPLSRTVSYESGGAMHTVQAAEELISTIPLHAFSALSTVPAPEPVQEALQQLSYMDIIFVLLIVERPQISNDTWLYFPGTDVAFNRAVEFRNWSPSMAQPGRTSLCLDITVTPENRELCSLSDDDLVRRCISDCERVGLCGRAEVSVGKVLRIPYAYPVYDLQYKERLTTIVSWLESFPRVYCLGRTGIFRYNNSDGSVDMGFRLAERLLDPACTRKSIFQYSMDGVSY